MDKLKQLLSFNKLNAGNFKKFSVWLFFAFVLLLPLTVGAQNNLNINTDFSGSGLPTASLTFIIVRILQIFFGVLGVIAVFIIMYAGFIWMTSQGDPNKVQKAKQIMTNAVIGLIIIFSAFGIATFIMNVLRGTGGGGGAGGGDGWGGRDDFGRSAIGAGPIESVYPAPNATNIPINTSIIVTFKQPVNPSSICNLDSNGMCDTAKTEAIELCQLSEDNRACLTAGDFIASAFDAVKVATSTDNRTFVFTPNKFLGLEDNQIRIFGVTLKNSIKFRDRDDSIFAGLRYNNYSWSFKTNGKVDLTPPEVAKTDMYPWPDNTADVYQETTPAVAGTSVLTFTTNQIAKEKPVAVNGEYFKGQALKVKIDSTTENLPSAFEAFFETQSGFNVSTNQNITLSISSDGQNATFSSNYAVLGLSKATWSISESGNIINTDAGFSITATGRFVNGSSFSFSVSSAVTGSVFSIASTSTPDRSYDFVFVDPAVGYGNVLTKIVTNTDGTRSTKNYFTISEITQAKIIESVNANNPLVTSSAGATSNQVNFTARVSGNNNIVIQTTPTSNSGLSFSASSLAGTDRVVGRTIVGRPDAYNNHIFRVTFTEVINPINIENSFVVKASLGNAGAEVIVPANLVLTNQYKTVELTGTYECGENSCGKKIYCWFDPTSTTESAVKFRVEVKPATIKYTTDNTNPAWCSSWGGSAVAGQDGGRCKMSVTVGEGNDQITTNLYYPQANAFDGVVDLASNSFNGNFNKAYNRQNVLVGKAEGPKGTGNGQSQKTSYYLANAYLNSSNVFTYTPNDSYGDDFAWEFFVSPLIDNTAPIIQSVLPVGDQSYGANNNESLGDPVKITFNTLMRYSTLKPGWGYGTSTNDKNYHIRYLALNTLTSNTNPVGYWSAGSDLDVDGDQIADLTQVRIHHNPLDNSVSYGPLAGSGLESINQNCYLPGMGPDRAGEISNSCSYTADGYSGCVDQRGVVSTNPSSYGYMNCNQIIGAVECSGSCRVHNATSIESENGSWIITKDKPTVTNISTGATGCCFGRCFNQ